MINFTEISRNFISNSSITLVGISTSTSRQNTTFSDESEARVVGIFIGSVIGLAVVVIALGCALGALRGFWENRNKGIEVTDWYSCCERFGIPEGSPNKHFCCSSGIVAVSHQPFESDPSSFIGGGG